jgi:hypothetical protein
MAAIFQLQKVIFGQNLRICHGLVYCAVELVVFMILGVEEFIYDIILGVIEPSCRLLPRTQAYMNTAFI